MKLFRLAASCVKPWSFLHLTFVRVPLVTNLNHSVFPMHISENAGWIYSVENGIGMTKSCNVKIWHVLVFHGPERISLKSLDLFSPFEVVIVQRHCVSPQMILVKCYVLVTNNGPMLNFPSFEPISLDTLFNIMNISCLIIFGIVCKPGST